MINWCKVESIVDVCVAVILCNVVGGVIGTLIFGIKEMLVEWKRQGKLAAELIFGLVFFSCCLFTLLLFIVGAFAHYMCNL